MVNEIDIATLHEAIAAEFADEPCVIATRTLTWGQVTERTRRLAAVLRANGLGERRPDATTPPWETGQDHLGVLLYNAPEYLEAVLGAYKASVAPFNINYRYTIDELAYLLKDADPAVLVYGATFAPLVSAVLPLLPRRPLLLQVADGGAHELLDGALDYESALVAADPADGVPQSSPDDRHLGYTGGTTGMPKGVIWRCGDMVAGPYGVRGTFDEAIERARKVRGVVLPAPPFMHGAGLGIAFGGWLGGATVVIPRNPERFDAAAVVDALQTHRVTSMSIVGDAFGQPLIAELERNSRALPDLRLLVNSGAALQEGSKARLRELLPGVRITDVLGSSETGLHAKRAPGGSNRFSSKGSAVVLNDARTALLEPGAAEIGWLAQGGRIPTGYLGDPDKTSATFVTVGERRYSVPGERARLLADGGIEFLGRDATTINTGGEKVFADEVEAVLRALPGVSDALVVGRPSERWGQEVVALVQVAPDVSTDQLGAGCREHLAGYKVPKAFIMVDRIQRLDNGKTDYKWAKALAAGTQ
ncbi:AMP-binding protein [Nocardia fluminea]|uniref:Acyl-CoA synthetase (AMP-forming)/AMP-acid ligase II n=1 Tax=Nocardia fluminea TaxID=134984 RepID=A0A2N3VK46_9NOCA|nr:AMP-binding protein [Nocardia fluminea]PKV81978.1 acyl-CoA synthetase (AMP-forming)/AMP-acid ligase II [Nocardia fluminea]